MMLDFYKYQSIGTLNILQCTDLPVPVRTGLGVPSRATSWTWKFLHERCSASWRRCSRRCPPCCSCTRLRGERGWVGRLRRPALENKPPETDATQLEKSSDFAWDKVFLQIYVFTIKNRIHSFIAAMGEIARWVYLLDQSQDESSRVSSREYFLNVESSKIQIEFPK